MDFNEYQKATEKTAQGMAVIGREFVYPVLGLVGEAGEVAEKVKKIFRDEGGVVTDEKREEITKELGDVLWYLAQTALKFNITLDDIATRNIEKTYSRLERDKLHGDGDNR